jgi:hypothetical protein
MQKRDKQNAGASRRRRRESSRTESQREALKAAFERAVSKLVGEAGVLLPVGTPWGELRSFLETLVGSTEGPVSLCPQKASQSWRTGAKTSQIEPSRESPARLGAA